jgi:uncharacterized protein YbjT (DUF2867 family)
VILVAGGTGTLGSRVVRKLLKRGEEVRIMTRDPEGTRASELRALGAEVLRGDVCDARSMDAAMRGIDALVVSVHALADPRDARTNNPESCDHDGVMAMLGAAKSAGVTQVVYVSIAGASADAAPEFVRIKHQVEGAVRASGMAWTIVRPSAFMETWGSIIGGPVITGGTAMVFGDGHNPVNFVSAEDVADFVVLALTDPRVRDQVLTVGGPENLTLDEVVALFSATAGHEAKVRKLPVGVLRTMSSIMAPFNPGLSRQMGMGAWMASSDQRVDMSGLLEQFPTELTRLESVARDMVSASAAS